MWESPIYKFKGEISGKTQDIFIDVTGSAPNFKVPGTQLEGTFKSLLKDLDPSNTKILDFGGAKLRNTLYLLKQGYTVYSCEFEDLFKRSAQAEELLKEAEKFPNFKQLVFPQDFINFEEKFDVILLINVLNIMPIQMERLCVLALCREKIEEGGRLLWYTQHGTYSESDAVTKLFDGLVTGKGRSFKMFYRDFARKEIHGMLNSAGFSFNRKFTFPTSRSNQAYLFNAEGPILVDKTLGLIAQLKKSVKRDTKIIERKAGTEIKKYQAKVPRRVIKPKKINILKQYSEELKKLSPGGGKKASKYHQLIFNILKEIFDIQLKNPKKEKEINQGRKRIDIIFDNKSKEGFFKDLNERYKIPCPIIFLECKNYTKTLENPEYDQIEGRLNKRRGMFGIIVCRKIENQQSVLNHCRDLVRENPEAEKYVLVLDDIDIESMIKFKLQNKEEEIDRLLDEKYKKLIM